jgi:hypothetical protein
MSYADEVTRRTSSKIKNKRSSSRALQPYVPEQLLKNVRVRMSAAKKRLEDLVPRNARDEALIYGLLASTEKRQAEVLYRGQSPETGKRTARGPARYPSPRRRSGGEGCGDAAGVPVRRGRRVHQAIYFSTFIYFRGVWRRAE